MAKKRYKIVNVGGADPYITIGSSTTSGDWWRFGSDNLFPQAVALLNRKSTVHRGILNSKTKYIAGKKIVCDEKDIRLSAWLKDCNANRETLRDVIAKVVFDKLAFGNAYIELVTNGRGSFLNIYHQDATKARLARDGNSVYLFHDWRKALTEKTEMKRIPIYPTFEDTGDGYLRSIIHIKEYEPEFENYGIMDWIAGLQVSAIAYKTDKWNISRLDNSFKSSGVLIVSGEFQSDDDWQEFEDSFNDEFIGEGKQGKILLLSQRPGADPDAGTRFIEVGQDAEGDWTNLHTQSTGDLIIAHGWFRALSGIADNTGFDTQRILNEYEVALRTVIADEQERFISLLNRPISDILRLDPSTLAFVNSPPATTRPAYMMVWEARKADGMEYDENDPAQQIYLANISQPKTVTLQ